LGGPMTGTSCSQRTGRRVIRSPSSCSIATPSVWSFAAVRNEADHHLTRRRVKSSAAGSTTAQPPEITERWSNPSNAPGGARWPPSGSGAARPSGALRAIDPTAWPRSRRTCGPRHLRRQSQRPWLPPRVMRQRPALPRNLVACRQERLLGQRDSGGPGAGRLAPLEEFAH
jgi:hypothetical protein